MIQRIDYAFVKLAAVGAGIVRDAIHDVAAPEALRIFERREADSRALLQIHELDDYSGGPDVDRHAIHVAEVLVDHLAIVKHLVTGPGDHGIDFEVYGRGRGEDLGASLEQFEINIEVGIFDDRLAGQPIVVSQEIFGLGARGQSFGAVLDLDDALMTDPAAAARSGNLHYQLIGEVEDRLAALQAAAAAVVRDPSHARLAGFPSILIVQPVVARADRQAAGFRGLPFVAAPKLRGALVQAVLVRAAPLRHFSGVLRHPRQDFRQAI